jgi:sugar lactone lactonase YvrE
VVITGDDTLYVVDSESGRVIDGPEASVEGKGSVLRNSGWKPGIRIGNARDGSLLHFIPNTRPEGLGIDEAGNIFVGLTSYCEPAVGCLQKYEKKK